MSTLVDTGMMSLWGHNKHRRDRRICTSIPAYTNEPTAKILTIRNANPGQDISTFKGCRFPIVCIHVHVHLTLDRQTERKYNTYTQSQIFLLATWVQRATNSRQGLIFPHLFGPLPGHDTRKRWKLWLKWVTLIHDPPCRGKSPLSGTSFPGCETIHS